MNVAEQAQTDAVRTGARALPADIDYVCPFLNHSDASLDCRPNIQVASTV